MKIPKRYVYQGIYSIPIIGDIAGKVSDDFFYKLPSFVAEDISRNYPEINKWVKENPDKILTNKKAKELIQEQKLKNRFNLLCDYCDKNGLNKPIKYLNIKYDTLFYIPPVNETDNNEACYFTVSNDGSISTTSQADISKSDLDNFKDI